MNKRHRLVPKNLSTVIEKVLSCNIVHFNSYIQVQVSLKDNLLYKCVTSREHSHYSIQDFSKYCAMICMYSL